MAGKAWRQELEGAGHTVSTVFRKQREMDAGAEFTVSFLFSLGMVWNGAAHIQDRLPHLS